MSDTHAPSLERAIAEWRRSLRAAGVRRQHLVELEDHLRSSVELAIAAGLTPAAAFTQAHAQLGDGAALAEQFHREDRLHPLSKWLGLAVAISAIVGAAWLEGLWIGDLLLRAEPLLLVVGMAIGGIVAAHGASQVARTFAVALWSRRPHADEIDGLRRVCRSGNRLAYAGGVLHAVLGTMQCFALLSNPAALASACALVLLGLVHAVLVAELGFATLERWIVRSCEPMSAA